MCPIKAKKSQLNLGHKLNAVPCNKTDACHTWVVYRLPWLTYNFITEIKLYTKSEKFQN